MNVRLEAESILTVEIDHDRRLRAACNDGGAEPQAGRIDATAGGHHVRPMTDPSTSRPRFVLCDPTSSWGTCAHPGPPPGG